MWQKEAIILLKNGASLVADVYFTAVGDLYIILRGNEKVWVRASNYAAYDFTVL